ncbi:MAG: ribosome small subunit-dependent GTPase A [Lachnospiraceae bacterium]|nr:ribosome small subunit-dependent GTPase A [Lachnospiraceae bacterium]
MRGKIIKGIAGFYYVFVPGKGIYECKAKGIFRKDNIKPLVGDNVDIDVLDENDMEGNITAIEERENELIRPTVANIHQALVIFAVNKPAPNYNLLDRFLVSMEMQDVPSVICFNKKDIASDEEMEFLRRAYGRSGYRLIFTSAKTGEGMDELMDVLSGKTSAVAGPSGVGKSSIINFLSPEAGAETGEVSRKIARGRHTTRHSEIITVNDNTFIMDTPGFSSLYVDIEEKEDLKEFFPEFTKLSEKCRFNGCVHINEPDCAVKEALEAGEISELRYKSYTEIFEEIKNKRRY